MQKMFTEVLFELFVKQNIALSDSLLIMSNKPKKDKVSQAAKSLYSALENGSLFSNALKSCREICFDETYISFVLLSERTGDLRTVFTYLKQKLERDSENKRKLAGASIYPTLVFLVSIAACIFIGVYTKTADFVLLGKYIWFLLCVCGGAYYLIFKMVGESRLAEAFTAVDFLVQSGVELSAAVECAVSVAGPSGKIGRLFEEAKLKLSYGMELREAFNCKGALKEAFYYADIGKSQTDLFARIAAYLNCQKEKRRTMCLVLIEPLFILITGGFIMMLLMTFFMPFINDLSWV